MKDKKSIRLETRAKTLALSIEERLSASDAIFRKVTESDFFRSAKVVAAYISLPDEPRTDCFLRESCHGKRLVVPRVEGNEIRFYDYSPERMQRGAFGILEPSADAVLCPTAEIELMIVPGTAFTREGARLGRGGGFYDRFMAQPDFRAHTIGVCFSTRIVDSLPVESHDRFMDCVISD